jgi:hypothetical protein
VARSEELRAVEAEGSMSGDRGRYSKVSRRIWNSPSFKELTQPKPCGAWLFFRLLTGPELSNIPGLFQAWEAGLAQALGWSVKDFRKAFKEVLDSGMAQADWSVGLVWLPGAIHHNEPESVNVVIGWRTAWQELPECKLKAEAEASLMSWAEAKGEAWWKAFQKATGRPSPKPWAIQEQKQEQEQEQKQGKLPPPPEAHQDSDQEKPMALTFKLHPAAVAELSTWSGFPDAVILEAVREFVTYWTIGGGAGKCRANWQSRCRDDIKRKHESGKLGEIAKSLGAPSKVKQDETGGYGRAEEWAV